MIIDTHCHAWRYWPYEPSVPDPEQRGTLEQLLFQMDRNGVDKALVVCANIEHNPDNNAYVGRQRGQVHEHILQIVDLDSFWTPTYHRPGVAARLQELVQKWSPVGFTHYLAGDDDGTWLASDEGRDVFEVAQSKGLLVSIHCSPAQSHAVAQAAAAFPDVRVLLHHLGHPKVASAGDVEQVAACAAVDNLAVKVSGFYYGTAGPRWEYPFADMLPLVRELYNRFGAQRMTWGSDFPVCGQFITYRQALEALRTHCDFMPAADKDAILGMNVAGWLGL